jgi:DNA-binding transcriptional ArsR family regulator
MDAKDVVAVLAALAQESRLAVFKLLVQAGPTGMFAGSIAGQLGIPASSLSFHLRGLAHAALVVSQQNGRFVTYSANFVTMNCLLAFLTDNCCDGNPCLPTGMRLTAQG